MEWIKYTKYNIPPQGLKLLCFRKGDLWVARRLNYKGKDYWIEFIYGGIGSVLTDQPDYWMSLELPEGYAGYMLLSAEGEKPVTFDEFQTSNPEAHEEFVGMIITKSKRKK